MACRWLDFKPHLSTGNKSPLRLPELLDAALLKKDADGADEEQALLEATSDEVNRGFLQGPCTEDEMINGLLTRLLSCFKARAGK